MAVTHGGNLLEIAARYKTDAADWLDLSDGVSPFSIPLGPVPIEAWQALPQNADGLEQAAQQYYQSAFEPLAVAGSQAAIMALPAVITEQLGRCGTVALPRVGYKEHEQAWTVFKKNNQRWSIVYYQDQPTDAQLAGCDVVVLINPNNPTGYLLDAERLWALHNKLAEQGRWLVVDEAFMDVTPHCSVLNRVQRFDHTVVLRSLGKFFGLAGARVGFVFANPSVLTALTETIGPWTVTGPSRWAAKQALGNSQWQQQNRQRLARSSERLHRLLAQHFDSPMATHALFITVKLSDAVAVHGALCQQQVLTRLCDEKNALRFGIPGDDRQWQKLESALTVMQAATNSKG
ncbi:threonine-phosphate decarboxylase CobD [Reinekea marinisedimentorum]|uniref:threonine-phosphate decarboxylase n=1 Tax=Reinekea marinisedimentorum TaxID=230495 RepID=A0A4R3I1F2_9GAMM|nr:threonine-phosphate decarboxylase CobD [Reinekea marinisedimentorum]TCS39034.1 cobalamin biosynthetic protein CobC [Reinekea marinisedimentorum]